jgi:hypothetical protein
MEGIPPPVLLFIDRLPLYSWVPPGRLSQEHLLAVCLPVLVTDLGSGPRLRARPQRWALDTRFTGEAYAWRHHLIGAGLDPDVRRKGSTYLAPLGGASQEFPLCAASLWLVSNIPSLRTDPYRIILRNGIAFRNVHSLPNPETNCPLLGMRAIEEAGLRVLIDCAGGTVSVWVPGPWRRKAWLFVRRVASGFATEPVLWG